MKAIIENNKVRLVTEFSTVNCTIVVPFLNIEKMKQATNCRIQKVEETRVDFNHNAGKLAKVTISVRFSQIENYLNTSSVFDCENKDEYFNLLGKEVYGYLNTTLLNCDKAKLYGFGNIPYSYQVGVNKTSYFNKFGIEKKYAQHSEMPRYKYSAKHGWSSNRAF